MFIYIVTSSYDCKQIASDILGKTRFFCFVFVLFLSLIGIENKGWRTQIKL